MKRCFLNILLILMVFPGLVYAADINSDKLDSVLQGLVNFITSGPAKAIFVLAIVGVGYGTLALGRIDKTRAVSIVIGVGMIYSAGYIAQQLGLGA